MEKNSIFEILLEMYKSEIIYYSVYHRKYKYDTYIWESNEKKDIGYYTYIHPSSITMNSLPDYHFSLNIFVGKDKWGGDKYYTKFIFTLNENMVETIKKN